MKALFQFNTSAIDVLSADGFEDRINDLLEEIDEEVRDALSDTDEEYDVSWDGKGIVVGLSGYQFNREYGTPGKPPKPTVRTGLLKAAENLRTRLVIRE